eukprot:1157710-Pelagomonas_calceolata.AAC.6
MRWLRGSTAAGEVLAPACYGLKSSGASELTGAAGRLKHCCAGQQNNCDVYWLQTNKPTAVLQRLCSAL